MKRSLTGMVLMTALALAYAKDKPMGVSERVAVASKDGKVLVTLTVSNRTAQPVYLPKTAAQSENLFGPEFDVKLKGGPAVDYIGPVVKRGPLTADDFVPLAPYAVHSHTLDITRFYAFLPGKHRYRLTHQGSYVTDLQQLNEPAAMKPASDVFTHTQPAQAPEEQ